MRPHARMGRQQKKEQAMAVELNHTIVPAHDPRVSAQFLTPVEGETA